MPHRTAPTPATTVVRTALVASLALALAGCGVRLETAPPEPLVPDAAETVRQRTVADALVLQDLAASTEHPDPAVQVLLDAAATASSAHVDALGGVYDPGTALPGAAAPGAASPSTSAGTDPPGATAGPVDPAAPDEAVDRLVTALAQTATTAVTDAGAIEDGTVARLLGAVAANRRVLGERLAAAAGAPVPEPDGAGPWDTLTADGAVPAGLTGPDVLPLVTAEDLAGLAWEVTAARRDADARAAAAERAARHRERAQSWAEATDVAGSGLDPRRTSYTLPPGLLSGEEPAAAADLAALETALADAYAALVARAAPTARATLLAATADATAAAARLTAEVPDFPGMPELAG